VPPRENLDARLARLEAKQRAGKAKAPPFVDEKFPAQAAFIRDEARLKMALCTRRAGKSTAAARALLKAAWENPGCVCLYLALTRQSAKEILWGPSLKELDRQWQLGCAFNETELTCTLPNGSIIYLKGADNDASESEKLLGKAYKLVVVDEAASFRQDLSRIVYDILGPAMTDKDGTIILIGTPSNYRRGLFFRVTTGQPTVEDAKWSVHRWSSLDNPYMREKILRDLAKIEAERPLFKDTPSFRMHWLGQWDVEANGRVYRFDPVKNAGELPASFQGYSLVLGVDLGHSPDPSAFALLAYGQHDPVTWVVETFKKTEMDFTDVATKIKDYQRRFPIEKVIIDGANKQGVAEMCNRHGLELTPADKRGKFDFINLLNDELIQQKVKLGPGNDDLAEELENLILDETKLPKLEEHPGCPNHLADAMLYAWRYTYSYLAEAQALAPVEGSAEWAAEQERLMREAAAERVRRGRDAENAWPGEMPGGFPEWL
jgi:hypothetical protein